MLCGGTSATRPATAEIQAIADQVGGLGPTEPGVGLALSAAGPGPPGRGDRG